MVKLVNSNLNNTFSLFSLVLKGERMMESIHLASIEQKFHFFLLKARKKVHEGPERVEKGENIKSRKGKEERRRRRRARRRGEGTHCWRKSLVV